MGHGDARTNQSPVPIGTAEESPRLSAAGRRKEDHFLPAGGLRAASLGERSAQKHFPNREGSHCRFVISMRSAQSAVALFFCLLSLCLCASVVDSPCIPKTGTLPTFSVHFS